MAVSAQPLTPTILAGLMLSAFCATTANGQIPVPDPKHYQNDDYQFSIDLPQGLPACMSQHTDHGVFIYLDRASKCPDQNNEVPYIGVFANYNTDEARDLSELARIDCRPSRFPPVPRRIKRLRDTILGGRNAISCRQYFPGGKVLLSIETLRKTGQDVSVWIEIAAHLDTTVRRYKRDRRIFRQVLKTVWIHPDGPRD